MVTEEVKKLHPATKERSRGHNIGAKTSAKAGSVQTSVRRRLLGLRKVMGNGNCQ